MKTDPFIQLTDIAVDFATGKPLLFANKQELTQEQAATALPRVEPYPLEKSESAPLTDEPQPDNVLVLKRRERGS